MDKAIIATKDSCLDFNTDRTGKKKLVSSDGIGKSIWANVF